MGWESVALAGVICACVVVSLAVVLWGVPAADRPAVLRALATCLRVLPECLRTGRQDPGP